jgi:hypothetical protein
VLKVLLYKIKWKSSMPLDEGEKQLRLALSALSTGREKINDKKSQVIK